MSVSTIPVSETREQKQLRPLLDFFSHKVNFDRFLDVVVLKTRNLPLRLLDWFCTNYSKKTDVCYNIKRPNGTIETFRVYRSYRAQLKGNKKKAFDPFARGTTVTLEYDLPDSTEKMTFETAICQLKFFKWAIENLLLDYVEKNYDLIYADMTENSSQATLANSKDEGIGRKKKTELSKSAFQKLQVSTEPIKFTFAQTAQ
jgi:hypothetical protein